MQTGAFLDCVDIISNLIGFVKRQSEDDVPSVLKYPLEINVLHGGRIALAGQLDRLHIPRARSASAEGSSMRGATGECRNPQPLIRLQHNVADEG